MNRFTLMMAVKFQSEVPITEGWCWLMALALLPTVAEAIPVELAGYESYADVLAAEVPDDSYLAAQADLLMAGGLAAATEAFRKAKTTTPPWLFDLLLAVSSLLGDMMQPSLMGLIKSKALEIAQAIALGDLQPNQYRVRWEHFTVTGPTGTGLKATVARPDPPVIGSHTAAGGTTQQCAPPFACYPVIVMPNSWAANILEYTFKQQEWASKGYVAVQYQTRGWFDSDGHVDMAGPADMQDVKAVLDEAEARAGGWRADMSRLAMAGISYGAGISLLGAAHDPRVKAVASMSGWGNLSTALAPQAAPKAFYYEMLSASAEALARPDPEVTRMWDNLRHWRHMDEVLAWADQRSPAAKADRLCVGSLPVLLSNNAEDGLFTTSDAFALRQRLHGAGCRVRLMINEGAHVRAELPGLLGVDSVVAHKPPVWDHVLHFLDTNLRRGSAPDYFATTPPVLFQLRTPSGYIAPPRYLGFGAWPPENAHPRDLTLGPPALNQRQVGAAGKSAAQWRQDDGRCEVTLAFGRATGINVQLLSGELVLSDSGSYTTTRLGHVNASAAQVFLSRPMGGVRLCGLPNASLDVRAFSANDSTWTRPAAQTTPRYQLAVYLWDVEPTGAVAGLITRGVRNVWTPGQLGPGGFDGSGQPLTVEMPAVCVDLPRGNMIGLGVALYDPAFTPANEDSALRVQVACDGRSRLELPILEGARPAS